MIIFINTASKFTVLALFDLSNNLLLKKEWEGGFSQSETLLKEINILLENAGTKKENLSKIIVNLGPGSYTGIRVGVTTANFLAFGLNIPLLGIGDEDVDNINDFLGKKIGKFTGPLTPVYLKDPFITKPKSRL